MRHPDISDGKIVFSYQGDLWIVPQSGGRATRLTVHGGVEYHPRFSPDGKWIAFTGDYFGGTNVFIIPSGGGTPKQLTYESSPATVVGWSPDSKFVIFSSNRSAYSRFFTQLFKVSIDGRFPEKLPVDRGSLANFSPDVRQMVFIRYPMTYWWWKRYKGTLNHDLWLYDFEKQTFRQLTDYPGNDTWPMWGRDGKIYFVSDRNGPASLFTYDLATGTIVPLPIDPKRGVQWPSMSSDGRWIVYESEGRLWCLNEESKSVEEVIVSAPGDDHFDMEAFVKATQFVQDWDISPHARRIVLDARGDLFSVPVSHGDTRNLNRSLNSREQHPVWSPDGQWIAYVSDADGEQEIYLADQMGREAPRQLTWNGKFKLGLSWSPDSKKLLFHTHDHHLYLLEIGSKEVITIARNPVTIIDDYHWSPDSAWVAYACRDRNFNADIHLFDVAKKESLALLVRPNDDYNPAFSPDGKSLIFLSQPVPDQVEIHSVSLLPEERTPYVKTEDEEEMDKTKGGTKTETLKKTGDERETEERVGSQEVRIEVAGLKDRVRGVPVRPGSYRNLQVTNTHYYFLSPESGLDVGETPKKRGMTLFAFDRKELQSRKVAAQVVNYRIARRAKRLVLWDGRGFRIMDAQGKEGKEEPISLDKVTLKVDRRAEWQQIFDEGWRMVRDYFYDPNLHGVDWMEVRRYYRSLLPYVRTREELNLLMVEMVGELNASHKGVFGGDHQPPVDRYPVALLGAELEPDTTTGLYRFHKIYRGDHSTKRFYAPLDADYVRIREGDYLLAINGQKISAEENYLKYLVNQHQAHIELMTNDRPTWEGAVLTRVKPITNDYDLRYRAWVEHSRRLVDEASRGKIGYIHLENMLEDDFKEFKRWFEAYRYKEALIIDVRYNGGGYIDTKLIDLLERRQYQITRTRHGVPLERPLTGFYGKVVVLCNEYSFSDAEVFPSGFMIRRLGTVIGKQTLGFVIAVRPHRLVDGGIIRQTFMGLWEIDGTHLESLGAIPDITVENTPDDEIAGRDQQLQKAIDFLMGEIEKSPRDLDYPTSIEPR